MGACTQGHFTLVIAFLTICAAALVPASGETVGLYQFDTLARDWTISGGPERFFDSSGNHLDFFAYGVNGLASLSSDVPPVAPDGSLSLRFIARSKLDTPSTNLFTVGTTGALTVEFWYKPLLTDTLRYILALDSGADAWGVSQASPPVNGWQGLDMFTNDTNKNVDRLKSQDLFLNASTPSWVHLAFTFDNTGKFKMYRNGVLEDQASNFGPYGATMHTLRIGATNPDATFAGQFLMDDLRISNVALPSGNGTGVNELAWNASLSQGLTQPPPHPATFGRDWVRHHPFMISSWGTPENQSLYRDANFNTVLSGSKIEGISSHFLGSFTELNDDVRTSVQWGKSAGVDAWLVRDEVPSDKIAGTAAAADYIRSVDPNSLIYVSLGGCNPTYIDNVITTIKPDAFEYGFYPWHGTTSDTDWMNWQLDNNQVVRQKSIQYGIPVFAFVQSVDDLHHDSTIDDNLRLSSGSELRTEMFLRLSAGFKGFSYYLFDLHNQTSGRFEKALINLDGTPSPLYYQAKQANAEILNLGRSLRFLESTDWRYLSGGVSAPPATIPQGIANAGSGRLKSVNILGAAAARKDALVGYFHDDDAQEYFMLVNLWHGIGLDPEDLNASFTLTFDSAINSIFRLNRLTGEPQRLSLSNHILDLTLPGGTGDLFKFEDGFFAGIPAGDATLDGTVDISDLGALATNWQMSGTWKKGDFNLDGFIDISDLGILATHWQEGVSGGASASLGEALASLGLGGTSVPEPASMLTLAALNILAAMHRRRL